MGDFNTVVDNDLDVISGNKHKENVIEMFKEFIYTFNLVDSWRVKNPTAQSFTWSRDNPLTARRLDYVLAQEQFVPFLYHSEIKNIGFSDHRAVIIKLRFSNFKRGPSIFKMNVSLLSDVEFVELIKRKIQKVINDNHIMDPQLIWENIKIEIRETTQQYSKFKQLMKRKNYDDDLNELNKLDEELAKYPDNHNIIHEISEKRKKLEISKLEKTKGAQIRAGIKWIEEGEQCNRFFLSLEKSRSLNNTIF